METDNTDTNLCQLTDIKIEIKDEPIDIDQSVDQNESNGDATSSENNVPTPQDSLPGNQTPTSKNSNVIRVPTPQLQSVDSSQNVIPESRQMVYFPVHSDFQAILQPNTPAPEQNKVPAANQTGIRLSNNVNQAGVSGLRIAEQPGTIVQVAEIPKNLLENFGIIIQDNENSPVETRNPVPGNNTNTRPLSARTNNSQRTNNISQVRIRALTPTVSGPGQNLHQIRILRPALKVPSAGQNLNQIRMHRPTPRIPATGQNLNQIQTPRPTFRILSAGQNLNQIRMPGSAFRIPLAGQNLNQIQTPRPAFRILSAGQNLNQIRMPGSAFRIPSAGQNLNQIQTPRSAFRILSTGQNANQIRMPRPTTRTPSAGQNLNQIQTPRPTPRIPSAGQNLNQIRMPRPALKVSSAGQNINHVPICRTAPPTTRTILNVSKVPQAGANNSSRPQNPYSIIICTTEPVDPRPSLGLNNPAQMSAGASNSNQQQNTNAVLNPPAGNRDPRLKPRVNNIPQPSAKVNISNLTQNLNHVPTRHTASADPSPKLDLNKIPQTSTGANNSNRMQNLKRAQTGGPAPTNNKIPQSSAGASNSNQQQNPARPSFENRKIASAIKIMETSPAPNGSGQSQQVRRIRIVLPPIVPKPKLERFNITPQPSTGAGIHNLAQNINPGNTNQANSFRAIQTGGSAIGLLDPDDQAKRKYIFRELTRELLRLLCFRKVVLAGPKNRDDVEQQETKKRLLELVDYYVRSMLDLRRSVLTATYEELDEYLLDEEPANEQPSAGASNSDTTENLNGTHTDGPAPTNPEEASDLNEVPQPSAGANNPDTTENLNETHTGSPASANPEEALDLDEVPQPSAGASNSDTTENLNGTHIGGPALTNPEEALNLNEVPQPSAGASNSDTTENSNGTPTDEPEMDKELVFEFTGFLQPVFNNSNPTQRIFQLHISTLKPRIDFPFQDDEVQICAATLKYFRADKNPNEVLILPQGLQNSKRARSVNEGQIRSPAPKNLKRPQNINDDYSCLPPRKTYKRARKFDAAENRPGAPANSSSDMAGTPQPSTSTDGSDQRQDSDNSAVSPPAPKKPRLTYDFTGIAQPSTSAEDPNQTGVKECNGQCLRESDGANAVSDPDSDTERSGSNNAPIASTSSGANSTNCRCTNEMQSGASFQPRVLWHCQIGGCPAVFESESDFDKHEDNHKAFPKKPFQCENCKKRYACFLYAQKHAKVCQQLEKMKCPRCPYVTSRLVYLKKHIAKHIRSIRCTDCRRVYAHIDKFTKHVREKHSKSVIFQCSQCPRRFLMASNIFSHMASHGVEVAQCGISRFIEVRERWRV